MDDIIIPVKLANIVILIIIVLIGNDVILWFSHEMGWDNKNTKTDKKTPAIPFILKIRVFIAENLRQLANKIDNQK